MREEKRGQQTGAKDHHFALTFLWTAVNEVQKLLYNKNENVSFKAFKVYAIRASG
jgi:hypothetical protein